MPAKELQKTLLLIDGSNLAFRMFFALEMSNLRNTAGEPTWAVYGTLRALFDVIEFAKPTAVAAAFDLPVPSFRHELFEEYKANRPEEMPEELQAQWPLIKDAFRYLNVPVLEEPGLEADDLIGIMAKKAEREGYKVVILSGDKDLYQLIDENIHMAIPQKGGGLRIITAKEVWEQMGVSPEQITDYKGIAGDSSDNIPGVKGLGPKTAVKLLSEYRTLEKVYENIAAITPLKLKEKLAEQEDKARLSKHIATIFLDEASVKETDLNLEHCHLDLKHVEPFVGFLKHLEFNSMLKRLPVILKPFNNGNLMKVDVGPLPEQTGDNKRSNHSRKYEQEASAKWENLETPLEDLTVKPFVIIDEASLDLLVNKLSSVNCYAIDLETTGLNTLNCEIVGWALAYEEGDGIKAFYIPVLHEGAQQLDADLVLRKLQNILQDSKKSQVIQNAKFEKKILSRHGIKTHNNFFDTILASYVNNPVNKHGLKAQAKRIFHQRMTEIEEIIGEGGSGGKKQITMSEASIEQVAPYASADAYMAYKLYQYYTKNLDQQTMKLLLEIEFPLVEVLVDIETMGVSLDVKFFEKLSEEIHNQVESTEKQIYRYAKQEFNIASTKQLSKILFENLGIEPIGKRNKAGNFSTDINTLEGFLTSENLSKQNQELIKCIIEYRTLTKIASTYVDNLPKMISKETERLHSDFNQVVTSTGRLSSSNPNLQNIPIKTEFGRQVRKGFITKDKDHILISADYSQIELRILAHMANEKSLIEAFKHNQDVHKKTAMEILGKSADEITDADRRIGKTLNFALIYMQGPYATANQLGIKMKEAKAFIEKYFKAFSSIQPFMDTILQGAHENGYTETLFGRRRYFRNINSPNKALQKEEERQAFNAPLQGTAADIMKKAMINLYRVLKDRNFKSKIILQVHDELVIEAPKNELEELRPIVSNTMQSVAQLKVPLTVDFACGDNWLEMK